MNFPSAAFAKRTIMRSILTVALIAAGSVTMPAYANDAPTHAIAMHGAPKHEVGFPHLPYANPTAPHGGTLTQCVIGTFDTLNDNVMKGKPADGIYLLNDPLMRRVWDEPFGLYGVIAKQVIMPDDRSSITFILNSDARFHNDTRITAKDVQFSFETLREKGKPNTRNVYSLVEKVTIESSTKIRFDFKNNATRETPMILAMMPIYSKAYWNDKKFDATTLTPPLGNGPYKIKSLDAGKSITYQKVIDYWARKNPINVGHYNFDIMKFDYYRDQQVALEAFKSGDCDIRREGNPAKWQSNYDDHSNYIKAELQHNRPEPARGFIMNMRRTPLNDINVRRALTTAFDFDWMNKSLLHNQAKKVTSIFSNSMLSATVTPLHSTKRERLKQASVLLDQSGWPLKDGKRFSLTILLNNPAEEKIALGYARDLKRLGITLNIRTLDTAQFYGALHDYDYDLVSWRWINSLSPGTEQAVYWGCDAANINGSRNYSGLCDKGIDQTIDDLANAKDYETLTFLAQDLDSAIIAQHPFIPLYYIGKDYVAYWPHLHHPDTHSLYGMVLETWWKEQK